MKMVEITYKLSMGEYKRWEKKQLELNKEFDKNDVFSIWVDALLEVSNTVASKYILNYVNGDEANDMDSYGESWVYQTNSKASIEEMQKALDEAIEKMEKLDGVWFEEFKIEDITE